MCYDERMAEVDRFTQWQADCLHWRKRVLSGRFAHWCPEWDGLPMDETCEEWPCGCQFIGTRLAKRPCGSLLA